MDEADAAATEPGGRRIGDGEAEIDGRRRIGGIAALLQNLTGDQRGGRLVGDRRTREPRIGAVGLLALAQARLALRTGFDAMTDGGETDRIARAFLRTGGKAKGRRQSKACRNRPENRAPSFTCLL